jgi:hypothetical protein
MQSEHGMQNEHVHGMQNEREPGCENEKQNERGTCQQTEQESYFEPTERQVGATIDPAHQL